MKKCSKCKEAKPETCFQKKGRGLKARCKACIRDDNREAYNTKPARRDQVRRAINKRRRKLTAFISSLKGEPCKDCGQTYPPCAMDFDHVRGAKKGNVANLVGRNGWSKERLLQEIEKCDLVCANCHRIRTHLPSIAQR